MSFFGQNNTNQQQGTGFGGFGSSNNTTGGFGQPAAPSTGFGSGTTNASGGFGGFGSGGTSGFGSTANSNSPFGQNKPAFGASTSGGGLFGGGTSTAGSSGGFGGFGTNNTSNTSGGGLFGSAPKPAFGSGSTSGGLFGSTNTGGFGSTNNQTTSAFGAPASSALGQNNAVCEGTGSTPFTAFTEKESATSATNHFQSISFMAPYKNFSFEELRLADYNQGRRFGNGSGQAGAFGSTNFGGFGQQTNAGTGFGQPSSTSGGGLFGSTTATSSPFGGNQTGGFGGSNTGSSLFGQKPGGSFGAASSSQSTGGLFGTANNTSTGFGAGNTAGGFGSGGGGLFGLNNQQQQSKPFSFGSTTATAGGGFGSANTGFNNASNTTNTGGGLFGQTSQTNNNPFGQQNTSQTSNPFNTFSQQNQNQNQNPAQTSTTNPFGGFGQQNQEQKPGGPFGSTSTNANTGGGLFSSQNNNQSGGGLFGQTGNNQNSGSSLFGQKPTTGGSLFGQTNTTNSNTSGSLFGGFGSNNANQNQTQANQGGALFGNTNNNQQKPSGLFGNTASSSGGSLFGNNNVNQQTGGGLFNLGGSSNQQQQPSGGSLFGNTANSNSGTNLFGNSQQQQPTPQNQFQPAATLQTSITDPNAFGNPSIFSGLPPPPQVSGPIATPINQKNKPKKNALLPYYKLTPNAASRLQTPQKRGFGFSYSTYGTPGSVSSNASTPGGLGSSLLHSSFSRGLGKSLSTSNLRGNYGDADSILTPGAFSAGSSRYGGAGSLKKLTIDRSLRTDLFGDRGTPAALPSPEKERQPGILKKKVSFDASTLGGNGEQQNGAQVNGIAANNAGSSATPSAEEQGFFRSPKTKTPAKLNGVTAQPEMEQVRGNELAIVPEDEPPAPVSASERRVAPVRSQKDQEAGDYWMSPSKNEIQKMTKEQRRQLSGFKVGRVGCGKVEFGEPVDVSNINLDEIYDNIVVIELRSLSVYPDQAKKPALGKGLNVPSTIFLENSWPRAKDRKAPSYERSGPRFNRHVERLRKVTGTEFVAYDKDTGTWIFKVPHFTTYGFDYDDEGSEGESLHMSTMTDPPDTPTPKPRTMSNGSNPKISAPTERSLNSMNVSAHSVSQPEDVFAMSKKTSLPGAFDEIPVFGEAGDDPQMEGMNDNDQSFLDERLTSPSDSGEDEPSEIQDIRNEIEDQSLVVRDEEKDMEMEMAGAFPEQIDEEISNPPSGSVTIGVLNVTDDWAQELQRSITPRKQDRRALRNQQPHVLEDRDDTDKMVLSNPNTKGSRSTITTHTDLMNSLFGQVPPKKGKNIGKATKQSHLKPPPSNPKQHMGVNEDTKQEPGRRWSDLVSKMKQTHPARLAESPNLTPDTLTRQRAHTTVTVKKGVPMATLQQSPFRDFAIAVEPDSEYERATWTLGSILFDDQDCEAYGVPTHQKDQYDGRIRKDRFITFWQELCGEQAKQAADSAPDTEERAIAHLSANNVVAACEALVQGKDYRLATLVAQIGGDQAMHEQISAQVQAWNNLNVLSEMSEPIRALYSLLAGEAYMCNGTPRNHIEDKVRVFPISERFDLDWKRAFGLRLYYAISNDDPIEAAIAKFARELEDGEPKKPSGDILYALLQVYAASKGVLPAPSLAHILVPQTAAPTPLTARLSFQLYHILTIRFPFSVNLQAADTLATTFAIQLNAANEWLWAMFALLHISNPAQRQEGIQALLAYRARDIKADPPMDETWTTLSEELKIPETWIWEAKALYARAVDGDRMREANYLVRAGQWNQAHGVLKSVVGPDCVIAEEWGQLQGLLVSFKPGKEKIRDWGLGGQVYEDYLHLAFKEPEGAEKAAVLGRLLESLPTMMHDLEEEKKKKRKEKTSNDEVDRKDGDEKMRFREMVALQEISGVVGKEVLAMEEEDMEAAKVLQLPSSENAHLQYTMELSRRYYQAVMAGGGDGGGGG